jgi:hypothetical protein
VGASEVGVFAIAVTACTAVLAHALLATGRDSGTTPRKFAQRTTCGCEAPPHNPMVFPMSSFMISFVPA